MIIYKTIKMENLKWSEWSYGPQTRFMSSLDINSYKDSKFFDGNNINISLPIYRRR